MASAAQPVGDPEEQDLPLYNEAGVDLTLVRWMLSLTPQERLAWLQGHANATTRLMEIAARKEL
ncbi:MAG: hypothetical protein HZB13_19380 [Acidobacteria bacterium]|nr:hypothetical protein [Acidobacteriota bacterium]